MRNWQRAVIQQNASMRDAIEAIQESNCQIALIVDDKGFLLGTITDGDIRRGLLQGTAMEKPALPIANPHPKTVTQGIPNSALLAFAKLHTLHQIPILDDAGLLCGLMHIDEFQSATEKPGNLVVLMAGGLGKRLWPLTENVPKPLLSIGDKPLLETIIESFADQGFSRIFISVNYLADSIIEYFGDGSRWGIQLEYLHEDEPLGTAGALRLLPERPELPMLVMNCDLITRVNFHDLITYHNAHDAAATMCVRDYDLEVPFGVVQTDGTKIKQIDEKPVYRVFVNAGVYIISPELLDLIPSAGRFDMTQLFDSIVAKGQEAVAYPIHEYWLDIGRIDDFERAKIDNLNGFFR